MDQMEQITLVAPDISCAHCQNTIVHALGDMPGVATVSVDIPTKEIHVSFDPARTTDRAIMAKLDDEGYPVTR
jgi:copper chaperone CopZ